MYVRPRSFLSVDVEVFFVPFLAGEFGVETLEQRVVSAILSLTAANDNSAHQAVTVSEGSQSAMDAVSFHSQMASKIILSGYKVAMYRLTIFMPY